MTNAAPPPTKSAPVAKLPTPDAKTAVPATQATARATNAAAPAAKAVTQVLAPASKGAPPGPGATATVTHALGHVLEPVTRTAANLAASATKALTPATGSLTGALAPVTDTIDRIGGPLTNALVQTIAPAAGGVEEALAPLLAPVIAGPFSGALESVGGVRASPGLPLLTPPKALDPLLSPGGGTGTTGSLAAAARAPAPGSAAGSPINPPAVLGTAWPLAAPPALASTAPPLLGAPARLVPTGPPSAGLPPTGSWWGALAYAPTRGGIPPARGASASVPVPAQGTAFPSSAGGASGFGFSIFIMLAALLVLGAPWTRRRLRLAGKPRWPAPFVLIPDRPG